MSLYRVVAEAFRLPGEDRIASTASLLDSLDNGTDDAAAAWDADVARRVADSDSGAATALPWDEARRRIMPAAPADGTEGFRR